MKKSVDKELIMMQHPRNILWRWGSPTNIFDPEQLFLIHKNWLLNINFICYRFNDMLHIYEDSSSQLCSLVVKNLHIISTSWLLIGLTRIISKT